MLNFPDGVNKEFELNLIRRQRRRWEDNVTEWTGKGLSDNLRRAEDRERERERVRERQTDRQTDRQRWRELVADTGTSLRSPRSRDM